jgi:hypothetical protein
VRAQLPVARLLEKVAGKFRSPYTQADQAKAAPTAPAEPTEPPDEAAKPSHTFTQAG